VLLLLRVGLLLGLLYLLLQCFLLSMGLLLLLLWLLR
jgi:hypothetical protein